MTETMWRTCGDPTQMVNYLRAEDYQRELRLFGVACVRRVWNLLGEACREAVEASEHFANGEIIEVELAGAVAKAVREAEAAGNVSAPNAVTYATSAAVDAASVWARTVSNVLNCTSCAASAAACIAAFDVDDSCYDEVFESAMKAELLAQAELLRTLVHLPKGIG